MLECITLKKNIVRICPAKKLYYIYKQRILFENRECNFCWRNFKKNKNNSRKLWIYIDDENDEITKRWFII